MTDQHSIPSLTVEPLSRAGSLPQWICSEHKTHEHPGSTVGAGLLAKGFTHPTAMQTDPPLSRAGSLPQWIFSEYKSHEHPKSTVGASLLAMTDQHSIPSLTVEPLSRASSLPQWIPVAYIFPKALNTPIMAGPMATRKKLGHRQKISGKISLVPIFAPISSAAWVRRSRNSSA